jgi:hypothetical protein
MDHHRPYRSFVSYIDRSREYYAAQGYSQPYAWAHYGDVPLTSLRKPLSECRVGLVTTAGITPVTGQSVSGCSNENFMRRRPIRRPGLYSQKTCFGISRPPPSSSRNKDKSVTLSQPSD